MKSLLLVSLLALAACETPSYLPKPIENLAKLDFDSAASFCSSQGMTTRSYFLGHYGRYERIHCYENSITQTGSIAYETPIQGFKFDRHKLEPVFGKIDESFEAPLEEEGNCKGDVCAFPIFSLEVSKKEGLCLHRGFYNWIKGSKNPSFSYTITTSCLDV